MSASSLLPPMPLDGLLDGLFGLVDDRPGAGVGVGAGAGVGAEAAVVVKVDSAGKVT